MQLSAIFILTQSDFLFFLEIYFFIAFNFNDFKFVQLFLQKITVTI